MSDLITFDDFSHKVPGVTLRTIQRLAKRGQFPAFVRLAPHGSPLWMRDAIDAWLSERLAPLSTWSAPQ